MQEKAKNQLDIYYNEMVEMRAKMQSKVSNFKETQREEIKNGFNSILSKDLQEINSENVDY